MQYRVLLHHTALNVDSFADYNRRHLVLFCRLAMWTNLSCSHKQQKAVYTANVQYWF